MERKEFIKACGFVCAGGIGMVTLLQGCATAKQVSGQIVNDDLVVLINDFKNPNSKQGEFKKYVIIRNEILQYPICVYRFSESEYSALWMRCTHQGSELQVFGEKLQCPAHGSEFTNQGIVQNGPADVKLRSFPIIIEKHQLKISLKAV